MNMQILVGQYFPQGKNFVTITHEEVIEVERRLKNIPRKVLKYITPAGMFLILNGFSSGDAFQG